MNKVHLIFGGLTAVSIGFSFPQIQKQQAITNQEAEEIRQARVAEARYKRGCTLLVAASNNSSLASITEGEPVRDRTTRKLLPQGTVVCDSNGNTAILRGNPPVATDVAFTGNRELAYNQLRKIRGAKVYHYVPKQGE